MFQSTHSLRSATCNCRKWLARPVFQSTHSLRSATGGNFLYLVPKKVSIHALLAECDYIIKMYLTCRNSFNPRTPCGVRPQPAGNWKWYQRFQSTHSLRSATIGNRPARFRLKVSIHALLAECDTRRRFMNTSVFSFNPRTPCGVRRRQMGVQLSPHCFNPRTPCGVRPATGRTSKTVFAFQSTHSLRSATQPTLYITTQQSKSYFAPTSLKRPSLHGYTF